MEFNDAALLNRQPLRRFVFGQHTGDGGSDQGVWLFNNRREWKISLRSCDSDRRRVGSSHLSVFQQWLPEAHLLRLAALKPPITSLSLYLKNHSKPGLVCLATH
jgi:hypothetical protein